LTPELLAQSITGLCVKIDVRINSSLTAYKYSLFSFVPFSILCLVPIICISTNKCY